MKKRIFSILLCLCMVLMLCPVTALAEETVSITEVAVYKLKTPVIDEHPNYGSWEYRSTPSGVVNVSFQWYQISKEAYTGAADDSWQPISSGYSFSKDYCYKAVFFVRIGSSYTETHSIPNDVNATINGKKCDIQIADDHKSCLLSYVFEAQNPQIVSTIAVTVDEPVIGANPDFEPEFTTTPADSVTLYDIYWYKISEEDFTGTDEDAWDEMSEDDVFEEGYYYSVDLHFAPKENYSFNEDMTATVNGKPHDDTYGSVYEGEFDWAYVSGVFEPLEPQETVTLTVPFTTTVKLGGNAAPGKTVFKLEIVDSQGEKLGFDGVEVTAAVTTNGKGSYKGSMTLTGSLEDLFDMLGEVAFVKQVDERKANWTYDDTVWGLYLWNGAELATDDAAAEYTVLIFPTICEEDYDGVYYNIDWNSDTLDEMTFTNTYTYSAPARDTTTIVIGGEKEGNKPVEENPNTGALDNVLQTGGSSSLTLWFALLAISAAGVIGTGAYCKRRRSSQAK